MPSRPIKDHYSKESPKIEDDDSLLTDADIEECERLRREGAEEPLDVLDALDCGDDDSVKRAREEPLKSEDSEEDLWDLTLIDLAPGEEPLEVIDKLESDDTEPAREVDGSVNTEPTPLYIRCWRVD